MFIAIIASVGITCIAFILKVMFDDKGGYNPTPSGLLRFIVDSVKDAMKDGVDKKMRELKELEQESEENNK